ncbi:MAG TPA: circadian clock KaiB family protein [candidate division Zixibacteria bacterium]|nr:circadian clock KaiB family protein [candidate division Zixibacteria bacterium]
MKRYILKLYIAGQTPKSIRAVNTLKRLCQKYLENDFDLEIIDVLEMPEEAERSRILATPTVIKELPLPGRRIIGDLSHIKDVMDGLDISETVQHGV